MPAIRPVILSGGSGTRLWPLSTSALPKQFAHLLAEGPLIEQTFNRLRGREVFGAPLISCGVAQVDLVLAAVARSDIGEYTIVVEPAPRNTAPAVVAAAMLAEPTDVLIVLPSDHLITDTNGFIDAVLSAASLVEEGHIVTFGIAPTRPDTGFGYIEVGDALDSVFEIRRFKEKPNADEAGVLATDGRHLWNSGMFLATASTFFEEAAAYCPDVVEKVKTSLPRERSSKTIELGPAFPESPSISFDHAIMEKTDKALVMPIDVGWSDVGSFQELWSQSPKNGDGNVTNGEVVLLEVSGSYVHAQARTVAVAGIDDVIVIETADAVLVVSRDKAQLVRDLSERISDG